MTRSENLAERRLPRVFAVHDMSGYGKCALTTVIPVVSACGAEVCPVPTALLSANTYFENFTMLDFTPHMAGYIRHWAELGVEADAVYSGFLGSAEQIEIIEEIIARFRPGAVIVDPVMGDEGRIYKTYTPEMCEKMKRLCASADVVTPNLTEAFFLCEEAYDPERTAPEQTERLARRVASLGAKKVVLTGVERGNSLANCVFDGGYSEYAVARLPFRMDGTGDLFASVLTGGIVTGADFFESVRAASDFTRFAMEKSREYNDFPHRGVCFEPYLHMLRRG